MPSYRTTILVCDNPACDYREEHTKDEPANGYHFEKGYWVFAGGGPMPKFYAHQWACILPALDARMKEEG